LQESQREFKALQTLVNNGGSSMERTFTNVADKSKIVSDLDSVNGADVEAVKRALQIQLNQENLSNQTTDTDRDSAPEFAPVQMTYAPVITINPTAVDVNGMDALMQDQILPKLIDATRGNDQQVAIELERALSKYRS
jgi:protein tyrosine phosphatase (PTP) superfamily phosphohydrolase (DUF442 family)